MNRGLRIGSGSRLGGLGAFGIKGGGVSDTTPPTVTITSTETSPSAAATIPLTITFSEVVTGFVVGDITVAGCTLSGFSGSGAVYTVTATPTAYAMTVDIAQNVCVDEAGNGNTAATQFTMNCLVLWYLAGAIPAANCKVAYQPIGAISLAASYVNLVNPGTNDATVGSAPGFDASYGWNFTYGPYLVTIAHALDMTGICRFSDAKSSDSGVLFGLEDRWLIAPTNSSKIQYISNQEVLVSPELLSGVLAISKTTGWRNGVEEASSMTGRSETWPMAIGGRSKNTTPTVDAFFQGKMQAIAFYDINLSTAQVLALTAAMNALP